MSASTGSSSEPRRVGSTKEGQARAGEISSSIEESAWANLKRRHRGVHSRSSSSPSPTKVYNSTAKFLDNDAQKRLHHILRTGDEEESKFGKSLIGLMQRSGRFDYCDFSDGEQTKQMQQETSDDTHSSSNGSVRRLMNAAGVRLTWRNLTNQTPCFIRKALSSRSPR